MAETTSPGLTPADVQKLLGDAGLGDIGTVTLATLPNPALTPRRTIWCSDLWSSLGTDRQGGRMVSEGGAWKPIRPLVVGNMSAPTIDQTIQPFIMGTTLLVTGTLSANRNITLGLGSGFALPYAGYRQRVTRKATGSLVSLLVNGVGLSLNGWADFEYDGSAWQQTASGGLL